VSERRNSAANSPLPEHLCREEKEAAVERCIMGVVYKRSLEMNQVGHTFQELWELVEPVVLQEGLELYDIERSSPSSSGGRTVIRVYLCRPTGDGQASDRVQVECSSDRQPQRAPLEGDRGVTLDDCASISRKLSALDRFDQFLGEHSLLEVSSPGVNRKLRTLKHFKAAIGERVRIKAFIDAEGRDRTITGFVLAADSETVELKEQSNAEVWKIPFADISSARIDFDFSTPEKKGKRQ